MWCWLGQHGGTPVYMVLNVNVLLVIHSEHPKHWCGRCRGQDAQSPVGPVHSVHPQGLLSMCIVPGPVPVQQKASWSCGCRSPNGRLPGEGLFLFISQRGEPTGSRLREALTQGRLRLLITPSVPSRMPLEQELGAGCGAECEPGARSSQSAASHDCKNFILFNNSNNSTKIIQSTFNTQGVAGQEERRPVRPGSITSRLQQRKPSWAGGHGGGGPIVKNKCGSVKKKKKEKPPRKEAGRACTFLGRAGGRRMLLLGAGSGGL